MVTTRKAMTTQEEIASNIKRARTRPPKNPSIDDGTFHRGWSFRQFVLENLKASNHSHHKLALLKQKKRRVADPICFAITSDCTCYSKVYIHFVQDNKMIVEFEWDVVIVPKKMYSHKSRAKTSITFDYDTRGESVLNYAIIENIKGFIDLHLTPSINKTNYDSEGFEVSAPSSFSVFDRKPRIPRFALRSSAT